MIFETVTVIGEARRQVRNSIRLDRVVGVTENGTTMCIVHMDGGSDIQVFSSYGAVMSEWRRFLELQS